MPTLTMPTLSSTSSGSVRGQIGPKAAKIDWDDVNYPPGLNVWHFDPTELDAKPRRIARIGHAALLLPLFALAFNLLVCVILAVGGGGVFWSHLNPSPMIS